MALLYKDFLAGDAKIGVWRIEEAPEFFLQHLIFSDWELDYFNGIKHPERRLSWLASRYLLKVLLETNEFVELLFDVHGKPFLGAGSHHISLSHTHQFAAAIISPTQEVGIDVEDCDRDISSISYKFLSQTERLQLGEAPTPADLLLYWGAKEVIYKMYGKRKLDFKDHMFIKNFEPAEKGEIAGVLLKYPDITNYKLHYLRNDQFSLVTGIGSETTWVD